MRFLNGLIGQKDLHTLSLFKAERDLISQAKKAEPGDGQLILANRQMLDRLLGNLVTETTGEEPHEAFFIDCQG